MCSVLHATHEGDDLSVLVRMMDYLLGGIISISITRARNSSCIRGKSIISQNYWSTSLPGLGSHPLKEAMSILSTRSGDECQLN